MSYEDDNETLDLFALAKQPPTVKQLLERCKDGCCYVKIHPLEKPKCRVCGHEFVR